jgi:hypothetical protein
MSDALEAGLYFLGLMVGIVGVVAAWRGQLRLALTAVFTVLGYALLFVALFLSLKGLLYLSDAAALFLTMLLMALAAAFKWGRPS